MDDVALPHQLARIALFPHKLRLAHGEAFRDRGEAWRADGELVVRRASENFLCDALERRLAHFVADARLLHHHGLGAALEFGLGDLVCFVGRVRHDRLGTRLIARGDLHTSIALARIGDGRQEVRCIARPGAVMRPCDSGGGNCESGGRRKHSKFHGLSSTGCAPIRAPGARERSPIVKTFLRQKPALSPPRRDGGGSLNRLECPRSLSTLERAWLRKWPREGWQDHRTPRVRVRCP